uniref:G-patch domain-containing protein n=1 Tax=Steinernema glaseri TaxID=37863 RepID=A0A1I8A6A4_9BILA
MNSALYKAYGGIEGIRHQWLQRMRNFGLSSSSGPSKGRGTFKGHTTGKQEHGRESLGAEFPDVFVPKPLGAPREEVVTAEV